VSLQQIAGVSGFFLAYGFPQAKSLGIDPRPKTPAISLLMKDPHTCIGVRAKDKDAKIIDFKAKAVVLATGGMSTNPALLTRASSVSRLRFDHLE